QADYGTLIKMKSYIEEMVSYLRNFADGGKVHFMLEADDVSMDVSQAVPLGLLLNEAITNALKYAFPGDRRGNIRITLKETAGETILLKINDDGQGFPENFNFSGNKSLGIQLIKLFSEQLEGDLRFENNNGAHIELCFKKQIPINTLPLNISQQADSRKFV
ncbi:MAG: ATP-binding protein, partial [Ferruginibacter sp.]